MTDAKSNQSSKTVNNPPVMTIDVLMIQVVETSLRKMECDPTEIEEFVEHFAFWRGFPQSCLC